MDLRNLRTGACDHGLDGDPVWPGIEDEGPDHRQSARIADQVMDTPTRLPEAYPEPCGPEHVDPTAGRSFPGQGSAWIGRGF